MCASCRLVGLSVLLKNLSLSLSLSLFLFPNRTSGFFPHPYLLGTQLPVAPADIPDPYVWMPRCQIVFITPTAGKRIFCGRL